MKNDPRFRNNRLIWCFNSPEKYGIPDQFKIKADTLLYFIKTLQARVWITNSAMERGLHYTGKNTFYFNTWHGTPIKKMGSDQSNLPSDSSKTYKWKIGCMTAQSDYEAGIFSRVFNIPRERFMLCGLPRNDILANYTPELRANIREILNLQAGKKVIIYMPTFREYDRNNSMQCVLVPPIDLTKWERKLGSNYIFLFRAHYEVAKAMDILENAFVRNVTDYPVLNHLMIASDLLISDYSSTFFDYSIMNKPMLHFTYDYDEYAEKRGMYFDIRESIHGANNEDDLIQQIIDLDYDVETKLLEVFRNQYVNYYGNAAQLSLDRIYEELLRK